MKVLAAIFGEISPPYKGYESKLGANFGLIVFLNNILKLLFVVGGLLAFLNLIVAGLQFLQSGGDPKSIEQAWNKIWQSLVGLLIIVTSFILAVIMGQLVFGDPAAILNPKIYGPGS